MDYLGLSSLSDMISKFMARADAELELRWIGGIDLNSYMKIMQYMKNHKDTINTLSTSKSYLSLRSITVGKNVEYMKKERVSNIDLHGMGIRVSLSYEMEINSKDASLINNSEAITRTRDRWSLVPYNIPGIRIDLTKILETNSYELEVECITRTNADDIITSLNRAYELIFSILNPNSLMYTGDQAANLIEFCNRTLLDFNDIKTRNLFPISDIRSKISYYPFPRPRNMKHADLVYGGIVGGTTSYSCTLKADGEHRVLVFDTYGTWLIHAPKFITLIDNFNYGLEGLMLEGELLGSTFYVYDCISIPDKLNLVQEADLNERLQVAQLYCDMFRDEGVLQQQLTIKTKTYVAITNDNFYSVMDDLLNMLDKAEYPTDGLIFTPNVGHYNTHTGSIPYESRVLTKYPDIVKWKPLNRLTIDFLVKEQLNDYELYVYGSGKDSVLFSHKPTVSKSDITLPDGAIVELGFEDGKPIMHRIRDDKILPNNKDVADATYMDIIKPIGTDMLTGRGFKLVRAYHNRIKKNLFNYALNKGCKTLLDLGSGRGGDLSKMKHFDKIFAVEPNDDNIEEMKKRLVTYNMVDKVTIIKARAQDTDIIRQELKKHGYSAVSCISSMLSMTFLWENEDVFKGFINTLNEFLVDDGLFIYLVMDGDHVSNHFRPIFKDQMVYNMDYGSAKISWKDNRQIHVHIDDSIVTEQDEWLVRLDDLTYYLSSWTDEGRVRADKELFLPYNEKMFSSLFTYGSYMKKKTIVTYPKPYKSRIPVIDYNNMTVAGDCEVYSIPCSWFKGTLVAITTIGDGSCFFHSIMKAINNDYFNLSLADKLKLVYDFRLSIAELMYRDDGTGKKYYDYSSVSQFQSVADMYKIDNITKLIANPKEYVGDFIYGIISTFYNYDILVLEYKNDDLIVHADTIDTAEKDVIVLVAYDNHFETLSQYDPSNKESPYTFVFKRSSDLVQKYIQQKKITKGTRR